MMALKQVDQLVHHDVFQTGHRPFDQLYAQRQLFFSGGKF